MIGDCRSHDTQVSKSVLFEDPSIWSDLTASARIAPGMTDGRASLRPAPTTMVQVVRFAADKPTTDGAKVHLRGDRIKSALERELPSKDLTGSWDDTSDFEKDCFDAQV